MTCVKFSCTLLIAIAAGCQRAQPRVADQEGLRADLVSDLHTQSTNAKLNFVADSVKFYVQPSRTVPGLTYHWAEYKLPGQIPPRFLYAVAGVREGKRRLLSTAGDWGAVVSGWTAGDSQAASIACEEILQVIKLRQGPSVPPIAYRATVAEMLSGMGVERSDLPQDTVSDTRLVRQEGTRSAWKVAAWYLLPGSLPELVKLDCEIPTAVAPGSAPRFELADSVLIPSQYQ